MSPSAVRPADNKRKVAVVTGGASGIGRAMARYLVDEGYGHVAILDVDATAGPAVAAELEAAGKASKSTVRFTQCDVASWASQAAAFAEVYAAGGNRIDVVLANAGISEGGASSLVVEALGSGTEESTDQPPTEPSMRTLNVNLVGVLYTVKLATHYLKKNKPTGEHGASRGSIICTASNAGIYPFPVAPIYAASKSGVIGLVRSLQTPLERIQIQINALAPAVLETHIAPDKALFENMVMTPMDTLVRGVDQILVDPSISGGVAEIHGDKVTFRSHQEYVDEDSRKNVANFWQLGYA